MSKFNRGKDRIKAKYPVPDSKLGEWKTPGFDIKKHCKLRQSDFADPLDYAKWNYWYIETKYRLDIEEAGLEIQRIKSCVDKIDEIIEQRRS